MTLHQKYMIDEKGNKVAVMLPIREFEKMMQAVEELEDIKTYDRVKKQKNKALPFEQVVAEVESRRKRK